MPQEFLHDFEFRTHASQKRRIRVTKRVPADAFPDSESLRNRSKIFAQDRLSQYGLRPRWRLLAKTQSSGSV